MTGFFPNRPSLIPIFLHSPSESEKSKKKEAAAAKRGAAAEREKGLTKRSPEKGGLKMIKQLLENFASMGENAPILHLIGPPGIGKSQMVREWAEERASRLGLRFCDSPKCPTAGDEFLFVDWRTTELDPLDLNGLPSRMEGKGYADFLPLKTALALSERPGVLFLDEFMNESRNNMIAAAYKIVRDRRIGQVKIHPGVTIVAASNPPEHSSIATSLPKPLRDRFCFVEVSAPKLEAWAEYMDNKHPDGWDKRVLAFLSWKPSAFLSDTEEKDDNGWEPPATPRGWEFVATLKPSALWDDLVRGKLGRTGAEFLAFVKANPPSLEKLAKDPSAISSLTVEQKYLVAVNLAEVLKSDSCNPNAKTVMKAIAANSDREIIAAFFSFLPREKRKDFLVQNRNDPVILKALSDTAKTILAGEH